MDHSQGNNQRSRHFEITRLLRVSITPEARMTVELVGILLESARTRLVKADGSDMLRVQGEARALEKLYRELTTDAPNQETM